MYVAPSGVRRISGVALVGLSLGFLYMWNVKLHQSRSSPITPGLFGGYGAFSFPAGLHVLFWPLQSNEWVPVTETESYCPATDQWTLLSPPPFHLCQFGLAVDQARLYVTGGGSLRHRKKEDGIFVCDSSVEGWEKAGSLPQVLVDHASCFVPLPRWASRQRPLKTVAESPATGGRKPTIALFLTNNQVSQATF